MQQSAINHKRISRNPAVLISVMQEDAETMNAQILDQSRLNVIEKRRSNIFNWRGQFTPQFIEYLLDVFAAPGQYVIDPFCGSGTVLLEAALKNLPAAGCEINPAAYAMAKFMALSNLPSSARIDTFERVQNVVLRLSGTYHDMPLFETHDDFRQRYKNLLEFAKDLFAAVDNKRETLLALVVLMRAESCGRGDLISAIRKACVTVKEDLLGLPNSKTPIEVELCDARLTHCRFRAIGELIITSPPYINVFNYHQNYRAILEVLGIDLLKVAESEIGSNRKNRANRFRTVIQYTLDMEQCLASFALTLKRHGTLILVVGHQSNIRGIPFSNSSILRDLAASLRCFESEGERHRVFTNRFGQAIREDIILLRNRGTEPSIGSAHSISEKHLKNALNIATGDPRNDIFNALSELPAIKQSPLFSKKGII
jgi:DNA modification methylase